MENFRSDVVRVVIVDDDPKLGQSLSLAMAPLGFHVSAFTDVATACEWIVSEPVDVALIDLQMSPVSGWQCLERMKALRPELLVLILSGDVDVQAAVRAIRAGAFDVLEKPVRIAELQTRIRDGLLTLQTKSGAALREAPRVESSRAPSPPRTAAFDGLSRLLGNSPAIARVREQVRGIARFNQVSTLIIGETGTGKEVVAEALHRLSAPDKPFVTINCAAIPDTLFESELFGHEAGSFTGARTSKPGLFETVGEGTLLLDEVGEMALSMQPKLLRVLQNRTFRRVGGAKDIELKARIVSATNRKLSAERQDGMRSDLYFRLAGFTIVLPPLRHRREDIDLLANQFLLDFANQYPGVPTRISPAAAELMLEHPWTGNVRELKRVIEQAAVSCKESVLGPDAVALPREYPESGNFPVARSPAFEPEPITRASPVNVDDLGLNELQQRLILDAYESNARNLTKAAKALRIPRTTLRDRLKRYGCL